jgi:hypothetical protein
MHNWNINIINTEGAIKNGQYKETGNIGHTRRRQTQQKYNTIMSWTNKYK